MFSSESNISFHRFLAGVTSLWLLLSLGGCGRSSQISDTAEPRPMKPDTLEVPSPFHADNDIAMVVGSLADALAVGESFDPDSYNFTGVLTDGGGAPLYVDRSRNPGTWSVTIESPARAIITNTRDGDLVASDIVDYLTACLHITSSPTDASESKSDGTRLSFSLPRGYLHFHAPAPDAMQGCHITIAVTDTI